MENINKIITEKDFWVCNGGTTPAQLQSRQKSVKKESQEKYITVADTATSSWIDFGCKKLMWIMAIAAAVLAVVVVATGGAALIAVGALAGAAGAVLGAVVGALICGQRVAVLREWQSSKPDMIIHGQRAITGADKMKCRIFNEEIKFAPNIKNWWQAIALGASNYLGGILEGMMYGAFVGAVGMVFKGGMAALSQFRVSNVAYNWLASWGTVGLGFRGALTTQSVLGAYGERGEVSAGDALYHGVFGMETGTVESVRNIFTGNGTMTDVIGAVLWFTPVHAAMNRRSRTRREESRTKNEEARNEESLQARTGKSKTPRREGGFEAFEKGRGLRNRRAPTAKKPASKPTGGKVKWVRENASMGRVAKRYNAKAPNARRGYAPALEYKNSKGQTRIAKFDGVDGNVMVDRKTSIVRTRKAQAQVRRQSMALEQNGMTGRWEVPNESMRNQGTNLLNRLGITNIDVKVVPYE